MRRISVAGALTVIALGGVLAFALQSSPRFLDLHAAGLIMMIAGVADLVIHFLLANSRLRGPQAADIAAVVESAGEPVLDVFGNPIALEPTRVLQPPPLLEVPGYGSQVPVVPIVPNVPTYGDAASNVPAGPQDTKEMPPVAEPPVEVVRKTAARDELLHDQVVRQAGDYEQPASLTPVYALTGRPVRVGRRRRRRG